MMIEGDMGPNGWPGRGNVGARCTLPKTSDYAKSTTYGPREGWNPRSFWSASHTEQ